jgi:plastocyanin
MKKIFFSIMLISSAIFAYSNVWTITTSGFTFSPATLTITVGDSVNFTLPGIHNAVEVDFTTWSANGITPLAGGFSEPLGGGMVLPSKLTVGTHYYVCTVHVATMGMKGSIIVENPLNVVLNKMNEKISIYPNPSKSSVNLNLDISEPQKVQLQIVNTAGQEFIEKQLENGENNIDIGMLNDGLYYIIVVTDKKTIFNSKIIVLNK